MTRINLTHPRRLTDQHLLAEIREIPRTPTLAVKWAHRKLNSNKQNNFKLPNTYRLGKGHVLFFYDKLQWLSNRLDELYAESHRRGFTKTRQIDDGRWKATMELGLWNDWKPSDDEITESVYRLKEKIWSGKSTPRINRVNVTREDAEKNLLYNSQS